MYYVYVLISESTGKRYTGQSDNLSRRLGEHNSPEHNLAKFTTRQRGPWRVIWFEIFETRREEWRRDG